MPPKKKLSKKEKARLEAEQAELMRIEMEKEKQKKLQEARQHKKQQLERAKQRQKKEIEENRTRKAQLKNSLEFFATVNETINSIKAKKKEKNDWEKYMRCNGLPNANNPSDLRKYIHQWQAAIAKHQLRSRNWLLNTNERTLLTQDGKMADLTRSNLRRQQGNLGDTFAFRVQEVLGILNELEEVLSDTQKPYHIRIDLMRLKMDIRFLLKKYLDSFTYKILSHIERDMEIDRPGVCKHIYEAHVFKSHVWAFSKDAQLSVNPKTRIGDQNQHTEIDFGVFEMQMSLPPSLILNSSAMRGLWLIYDHLSDYCPSFKPKKRRPVHFDMLSQTKKEWRKRKEILQKMLNECANEDPMAFVENQDENSEETTPVKKYSFDIDKVYTEYEDELAKARRSAIGPESFGLASTDVNLRKYRIIGGLYCVDYLETPHQDKRLNSRSFIRTISGTNNLTRKNFYQLYKPPPAVQPGVRRLPEEIEAEMRMVEAALDKLILVTLQLPDTVIWFEPPVVCRWETTEETIESEMMDGVKVAIATSNVTTTEITPVSTNTVSSPVKVSPRFPKKNLSVQKSGTALPVRTILDFDLLDIPPNTDIHELIKDFVVPRLPISFHVQMVDQQADIDIQNIPNPNILKNKESSGDEELESFLSIESDDDTDFHKMFIECKSYKKQTLSKPENRSADSNEENIGKLKSSQDNIYKLSLPRRIDQEFLDLDEPCELFPTYEFHKVLDIRKRSATDLSERGRLLEESFYSLQVQKKPEGVTEENQKSIYKFSEFLEDLDRLWNMQQSIDLKTLDVSAIEIGNVFDDNADTEKEFSDQQSFSTFLPHSVPFPNATKISNKHIECEDIENVTIDSSSEDEYDDDEEDDAKTNKIITLAEIIGNINSNEGKNDNKIRCPLSESDSTTLTQGKWSTRDVHDTKFNEDKLSIQFRTGRLGVFGFALNRYSNMPYQTWETKPDFKKANTVLFSFTASIISLDISITSGGYCLNNFQGGMTTSINDAIGKTISLSELKTILISSAVDIFPDEDTFCYTEGSCEKNFVMEMHLYACMSTLALSYNFSWSRWNLLAGSRTAVLLTRELIEGKKVPFHSTLLVTPMHTTIIDCTEVSASFNATAAPGMEYYADLYQLTKTHAQPVSLRKQRNMDPILGDNVANILMAIRPLSFC